MEENNQIKNLIIDMDGVLWKGETPMSGLVEFFDTLRRKHKGFVLATNNATKTTDQYVEKLANFGVEIPIFQVLTSSEATAQFIRRQYPARKKAYIVGEIGLQKAMHDQGFDLLEADGFVGAGARADFVVVGMTRHVCYQHLASASYLINHGAMFIGTNPDITLPTEVGPLPGAGSILAFIETATNVTPFIVGKPNEPMFKEALRRLDGNPADTVMVGDRLNTDIVGGHRAGLRTILVLTGISKEEELANVDVQPDWVFQDLIHLAAYLENSK
jgi:4-nitrophenyl phosphatase